MNTSSRSNDFDSLSYWRARHDQYLKDPTGVGNVMLSAAENDRIYKAMERYVAQVASEICESGPGRVLDLGCGIGMLAPALVNSGFDYTGVDISPTAIDLGKQKEPRGRFEVANIARLPFTEPFDIILERTVFIHLVEDDYWNAVISEVGRLLAPRGTFLIMDHLPRDAESVPGRAPHVKFRLYDEYAVALGRVGLGFNEHARRGIATKIDLSPHTHLVTHKA